MKRLLPLFLLVCSAVYGQAWSGVLAPSRAIDWSKAGLSTTNWPVTGETNPASNMTPPPRTTICSSLSSGATAAQVNTAISGCAVGQTVLLGAGTYNFAGTTIANNKSGVTFRGAGADQTFLSLGANLVSMVNSGSEISATWTAGFTKGTTSITIGTNIAVGTTIRLTANDSLIDSGGPRYCSTTPECALNGGIDQIYQVVRITAITPVAGGFSATIQPGLELDFTGGSLISQSIIYYNPVFGIGLEDMSITCTNTTGCVDLRYSHDSWIKGCRIIGAPTSNGTITMTHGNNHLIMNNYVYGSLVPFTNSLQLITDTSSDDLIINNIFDAGYGLYNQGPSTGVVYAYNLSHNQAGSSFNGGNWNQYTNSIFANHGTGNMFLFEGNIWSAWQDDLVHGAHNFNTAFRNLMWGDPPMITINSPTPVSLEGFTRFDNVIANILATPGVTQYKALPSNNNSSGWMIGSGVKPGATYNMSACNGLPTSNGNPGSGNCNTVDWQADKTNMFWGNWDTATNATRWCGTGVTNPPFGSAPCNGVSEVPSALNATTGFQLTLTNTSGNTWGATIPSANFPCILGNELIFGGLGPNGSNGKPTAGWVGVDLNANGTITNGSFITSGSVNCNTTGTVTVTFSSTPSTTPFINYQQQLSTASSFQNSVPTTTPLSTTLTPTFFLPATTAHPSCGTGLPFWKTFTNYPTNTTSVCPAYPPIGSDVVGGNMPTSLGYPAIAGHANQIPAWVAYQNLPIDTSLQTSFTITAWNFSTGAAVAGCPSETISYVCLTVSGLDSVHATTGEFQIKGATGCSNFSNSVLKATPSSIAYPATTNPGCSGGTFNWPDVRQFNELVYANDPAGGGGQIPTPTFSPVAGAYVLPQLVTVSESQTGTTACYTTDGSIPTTNGAGTCTHGTSGTFPFTVNVTTSPTTINVIATASGFTDSNLATALYTQRVATPTFAPVSGYVGPSIAVVISDTTSGATACYTTDGSTPTTNGAGLCTHGTQTAFPATVNVSTSETINVVGTENGFTDSALATWTGTITGPESPLIRLVM